MSIVAALELWAGGTSADDVLRVWPHPPRDAIEAAWVRAVVLRRFPCRREAIEALRRSTVGGDASRRLRSPEEIARRIALTALSWCAADAHFARDDARHVASIDHPAFLGGGPLWLENAEARLLISRSPGKWLDLADAAQLRALDHAAVTLAWAAGWVDSDPFAESANETSRELVASLPRGDAPTVEGVARTRPRPLGVLEEALERAVAGLDPADRLSRGNGAAIQRMRALRWIIEPWWPELALTPWLESTTAEPATAEGATGARVQRIEEWRDAMLTARTTWLCRG